MNVLDQVRTTVDVHDLLPSEGTLVVAVSGGPDSLCLLHVLVSLSRERALRLHVAHLNHRLRPEAADEAACVAALAAAWGLPHSEGAVDVRALAQAEKRSLEEAARIARYRFLAAVARKAGAERVATGHNADDQVETVVMHFLRGSGLAGLRGMRYLAPWPETGRSECPEPVLIRPLLDVPRGAIEAYCHEHDLLPCYDRSNVERTFFRNRIRHELLPLLETYNPRFRQVVQHTAQLAADDYAYLQQNAEQIWPRVLNRQETGAVELARASFRELPPSPQRSVLRRAIAELRPALRDIGWLHVERARQAALVAPAGARIDLPGKLWLEVHYDTLILRDATLPAAPPHIPALSVPEMRLQVPGTTQLAPQGWAIEARFEDVCPGATAQAGRWTLCLDADQAGNDLRLRWRQAGDRFQPRGLGGHSKSVKEYLIDAKIPRAARGRLPLLVSERGILWIVGCRGSELGAPNPATRRLLCLQLLAPEDVGENEP